ncbi:MAG: CHAT domain-containing protein [Chloroflexota bacterium]
MQPEDVEELFSETRGKAEDIAFEEGLKESTAFLEKEFSQHDQFHMPVVQGFYWRVMATLYMFYDQHENVIEAAGKSAESYSGAGFSLENAKSKAVMVTALGQLHRLQDAENLANELLPIFEENSLPVGQIIVKNNLAYAYSYAGNHQKSLAILREVHTQCLEIESGYRGMVALSEIALQLELLERYDETLKIYDQIFEQIKENPDLEVDQNFLISLRFSRAILLFKLGLFEDALMNIGEIRQNESLAPPSMKGYVDLVEGVISGYLGDSKAAIFLLRRAVNQFVDVVDQAEAVVYLSKNLRSGSHPELEEALTQLQTMAGKVKSTENPLLRLLIFIEQAEINLVLGRTAVALQLIEQAEQVDLDADLFVQTRLLKVIKAESLLTSDPEAAREELEPLRPDLNALPVEVAVRLLNGLGRSYMRLGQFDQTFQTFQESVQKTQDWSQHVSGHASQAGFLQRIRQPFDGLMTSAVAKNLPSHALLNLLEQVRGRALEELGATSYMSFGQGELHNLFEKRERLLRQIDHAGRPLSYRSDAEDTDTAQPIQKQQLVELQTQVARLNEAIQRKRSEFEQANQADYQGANVTVPAPTFLTWFETTDHLFVLINHAEGTDYFQLETSVDELENEWESVFRQLTRVRWNQRLASRLTDVWQKLTAPVDDILETVHKLVICPIGALWQIPYGVLQTGGRFVGDVWELVLTPSLNIWQMCQRRDPQHQNVLLAGETGNENDLIYLPSVASEIEGLSAVFPDAHVLLNELATRENFFQQLANKRLIHIAGHIEYVAHRPVMSGIRLHDNRYIRASDFYLQPGILDGADVVLSGCESGRVSSVGTEIVGLTSSLVAAGARSVLVTLWPVDDAATAHFMKLYYQHLLEVDVPSKALHLAQADMRQSADYAHPIYWGAFVSLFR